VGTGGKVQLGHDADHSPPCSELELYLLSPQAPPWHVVGLIFFSPLEQIFGTTEGSSIDVYNEKHGSELVSFASSHKLVQFENTIMSAYLHK
jgi:hypothetical protein